MSKGQNRPARLARPAQAGPGLHKAARLGQARAWCSNHLDIARNHVDDIEALINHEHKDFQSGVVPLERENITIVVYMCSTLLQLAPGSHDSPQAEKRITVRKAEQIHKMTTIFTQNGPRLSF